MIIMPRATFHFPQGFLWGTATAAHQVEGFNSNNDMWAWEQQEGRILNGDRSGRACDWWAGRWREDLDRAHETYQNAHRLSVEWSRIQPAPDRWDEQALDKYRDILKGLKERKMVAMVTLHHFTNPMWVAELGGWENDEVVELFAAFVRKTVDALKPYCNLWVTINEPNIYAFAAYLSGDFYPGKKDIKATFHVLSNMVKAHAAAYRIIHELQSDAQVGFAHNYRAFKPASWSPFDKWMVKFYNQVVNQSFADALTTGRFNAVFRKESIPEAANTQDFIGLDYYSRDMVSFKPFKFKELFSRRFFKPEDELSESGFLANVPEGFVDSLKWAHKYALPIYVTENGVEDSKDDFRRRYLIQHLHKLWHMVSHNYQVKGYFHWCLVDNFEWERGWTQRFGLWGLDVTTQARIRRPSVDMYKEICRSNSISSDVVQKFTPEIYARIYPE